MLCETCQSIFKGERYLSYGGKTPDKTANPPDTEYKHYPTLTELKTSAEGDCHLYLLTCDSIEVYPGDTFENLGVSDDKYPPKESPTKSKHHKIRTRHIAIFSILVLICLSNTFIISRPLVSVSPLFPMLLLNSGGGFADLIGERTDIRSKKEENLEQEVHITSSERSWNIVMNWHKSCTANHPNCGPKYKGWWLPTRLLDVKNGLANNQVRLCCTDHLPPGVKYTSLSHCWGTKPCIRLTSETLSAFKKDIPVSDLSNTFRDAITITRRLGVRYLWIDSLCTIQDSLLDWQRESAKMRSVYANSFLNIAATESADSEGGYFKESNS